MKRPIFCASILANVLIFSACNSIDTPNGKIPENYQAAAREKLGIYSASLDKKNLIRFELIMESDSVRAQIIDGDLGKGCQAELGELKRVAVREESPGHFAVTEAAFAFNPNLCSGQIPGREFVISWRGNEPIAATFLNRISRIYACGFSANPALAARMSPNEGTEACRWEKSEEERRLSLSKIAI